MRVLAPCLLLAAACGDNVVTTSATLVSGAATITVDATTLTLSRDGRTLLTFPAASFEVGTVTDIDSGASFDPFWLDQTQPDGLVWHHADHFRIVTATDTTLSLAMGDVTLTLSPASGDSFEALLSSPLDHVAYLRIAPDADAHEGFYGLGEWADGVDHRGKLRAMQMEIDPHSESSDIEDHVPVPFLSGTTGWGLFVASAYPGAFDVARATDTRITATFGELDARLHFHLFTAAHPLDLQAAYLAASGSVRGLPAPWALGPLLWRDENASQAQVIDDIAQIRTRHLPTTGVWFDRPYATGVNTFDWSATKFNDPPAMLQALHDAGLRYGIWHVPYVAPASNADPAPDQLAYATAHGFFPSQTGVLLNPWGKPLDLTNPDATAWWTQQLHAYTDAGVEGFKLDYAEDIVLGLNGQRTPWKFADGSDERTMHRDYQRRYHDVYRRVMPAEGGLLLVRTGRWGEPATEMIVWPGDLDASFAREGDPLPGASTVAVGGLPAALTKGINLAASGFPFYASDTGGYRHSPPGREVWVRWVEANSVWPAMEVGDSSSQMPWEYTLDNGRDDAALATYRRYALLHLRLFPYTWTYAQQLVHGGRSIVRPVGLAYPELGEHPADEYLMGDALLVAPVVAAGQTSRSVLLPPGVWLGWWDGAAVSGRITAAADIDTLPLYIARGSIVPLLRDTIETLSPVTSTTIDSFATDPGVLGARVAPGDQPTSFTLYDGTRLAQQPHQVSYTTGSVFVKGALFEIIATAQPTSVSVPLAASRAALDSMTEGYFWEPATGGTLWIKTSGTVSY